MTRRHWTDARATEPCRSLSCSELLLNLSTLGGPCRLERKLLSVCCRLLISSAVFLYMLTFFLLKFVQHFPPMLLMSMSCDAWWQSSNGSSSPLGNPFKGLFIDKNPSGLLGCSWIPRTVTDMCLLDLIHKPLGCLLYAFVAADSCCISTHVSPPPIGQSVSGAFRQSPLNKEASSPIPTDSLSKSAW